MSAYIVEAETINRIVAGLRHEAQRRDYRRAVLPTRLVVLADNPEALVGAMHKLNCQGVRERYEDAGERGMIGEPPEYEPVAPPSQIQLVKSLACFLYQCAEGKNDTAALYTDLTASRTALEGAIVDALPEYEAAAWA